MKNLKKKILQKITFIFTFFYWLFCFTFCSYGCSCIVDPAKGAIGFKKTSEDGISIILWNLQTFFDGVECGNEYEDFIGSKTKWNVESYKNRVRKLCNFIESQSADIFVFIEIENEDIFYDISNFLQVNSSKGTIFQYGAFSKSNKGSLGIGVLSSYPINEVFSHQISFASFVPTNYNQGYLNNTNGYLLDTQPEMRPIFEVHIALENQDETSFVLLVNHWKSKSGDEVESEIWRNYQEMRLCELLKQKFCKEIPVVLCGDFNRELSEFLYSQDKGYVELRGICSSEKVFSPWFTSHQLGSYVYKNNWERIDHFFTWGNIQLRNFSVIAEGAHVSDSGYPKGYNVWSGEGYSDHLPLQCTIFFTRYE